jgi:hypothetical protein
MYDRYISKQASSVRKACIICQVPSHHHHPHLQAPPYLGVPQRLAKAHIWGDSRAPVACAKAERNPDVQLR